MLKWLNNTHGTRVLKIFLLKYIKYRTMEDSSSRNKWMQCQKISFYSIVKVFPAITQFYKQMLAWTSECTWMSRFFLLSSIFFCLWEEENFTRYVAVNIIFIWQILQDPVTEPVSANKCKLKVVLFLNPLIRWK